tara:strand:+ start:1630 stop:2349 length:720 start_codon:yes stop_codon:yes gene_type:complete
MFFKLIEFIKNYNNIPKPLINLIGSKKKTVAIVGNSEILKDREYGKIIDDHDFIIRFNRSPIINYEKIVGSKTHLRVCGQRVFENREYPVPGLEYYGDRANYIKKLKNSNILVYHNNNDESLYNSNIKNYTSETNNILYFHLKYEKYLKFKITSHLNISKRIKIYKLNKIFTSGMITLATLVLNNFKPSVFGFSLNKRSSFYTSYWQKGGEIKKPVHELNIENELLEMFIKKKKIKYFD